MFKRLIFIGCVAAQTFIWYNVTGKERESDLDESQKTYTRSAALSAHACLPRSLRRRSRFLLRKCGHFERLHKLLTTDVTGVLTVYTLDRGDVASSHSYLLMKDDAKLLSDLLAEYVGE